jgi:hypothetical protein
LLSVKVNTDDLERKLRTLGAQRIPNHLARALNDLGKFAQSAMIAETSNHLTVRGPWTRPGTRFGFNLNFANKRKLEATVFSRAPWLFEQEEKESRRATRSRILVPLDAVRKGRDDPKKIPRRLKPAVMGSKLFQLKTSRGVVLARRVRKKRIQVLWALESLVHWPKRVHVKEAGKRAVVAHRSTVVSRQVRAAIREQGL